MSLTPEEKAKRAERSRRNGAKSRGALTEESRRRGCLNALKSALRAKTYPLPHEREAAAARSEQWHNWYGGESPAAIHLTNECARATIIADRSDRFREAEVQR